GIRDRNVTGVQTCALPISKSTLFHYSPLETFFTFLTTFFVFLCGFATFVLSLGVDRTCFVDLVFLTFFVLEEGIFELLDELFFRSEERRVGKEFRSDLCVS